MTGITQKSCVVFFPLWSVKKNFWGGRTDANQQKHTKKFRVLTGSHVSMMKTVTMIVISVVTKIKNSNSNNSDH